MEAHGPWASPPPWLMELLSSRLEMQDRAACLAVCKGWASLESELFSVVGTPLIFWDGIKRGLADEREDAPTVAEFAAWLERAAQRWRPGSVRKLHLNLEYAWLQDPGHEGWDYRHCSQEAAAAIEAALEAVLARRASGLQLLELTGGSTRVHGPDEEGLGRIVALLRRHAPQLHQLRQLQVEQDFAAEALAPALGCLQAVTRLTFLPPCDIPWPIDLDRVEGMSFPQALRSAHINWLERFPVALAQCPELVDLEVQFRFPAPVKKHIRSLQELMMFNGVPPDQVDNIPEEMLEELRLIEPRELRPLAHPTQLTSLCISGGFQQTLPSFSALGRLQDLHFSTTRQMSGEDAFRLRDLGVFLCHGFELQPGPWQGRLVKLEAAWRQLAPNADVAARACAHLTALQELKLSGWGQKPTVPSAAAVALLGSIGVECRSLRKLQYSGNSIRWGRGEERAALEALLAALPGLQLVNSYGRPLSLPSPDSGAAGEEADDEEEQGSEGEAESEEEEDGQDADSEASDGPPACTVM